MVTFNYILSTSVLAGLARATVTSVVYSTVYETDCNACAPTTAVQSDVVATGLVVVAPAVVSSTTKIVPPSTSSIVGTTSKVATSSAVATTTVVGVAVAQAAAVNLASSASTTSHVAAASASSIAACPATAHTDALGSKNYPRVITPVSSTSPNTVYGPQYFASIGGGNSTIFTFDYQTAGTCTLEFKFPTTAQIQALKGTTSYDISSSSIAVDLYQLTSVASPNADYANKPARGAEYSVTLTPGTNTTITSFACPVGTSVSYELVAADSNTLSWFEDYNPPPLGLLALMC